VPHIVITLTIGVRHYAVARAMDNQCLALILAAVS
jgi:hypothetical protein